MKKILLFFAAAICAAASWAQDATVSATVKDQQLEVALTNPSEDFVAFQVDITLPDGVSVNANGAVALVADRLTQPGTASTIDANETVNFVVAYNQISEHVVRVLAYNLENRAIAGKEGTLFTMTFTGSTSENFTIDNSLFVTTSDLVEIKLALAESIAQNGELGDINKSGSTNLNDITALRQIIMNDVPAGADYDMKAADVNNSGGAPNLNDLTALIEYVMNK